MLESFGPLNGHACGIVMKELVRRAISTIRAELLTFEVQGKIGYDGSPGDMVTTADKKAQEVYLRSLRECFPKFGIVGEEDELRIPCTLTGEQAVFTLDPVDGTKALVRRQSHGIGTMLSLVIGGRVASAFVGDVMTQEIYGYRPGSEKVHRISEYDTFERLEFDTERPLSDRFVLLHDPLWKYTPWTQAALDRYGLFKGYENMGGSVGIWLARLWKGEVGAAILPASHETPWDSAPILGISDRMGFRLIEISPEGERRTLEPEVDLTRVRRREGDLAIVHADHLNEFLDYDA